MIAWAFPGQGSQRPKMGLGVPAFAALAMRAQEVTGIELTRRSTVQDAPTWQADELQQAIFVATSAVASTARDRLPRPGAVVGHSLGDYAALVEAEVLDFDTALELVDLRGRAMARAGADRPGAMAAVLGLPPSVVTELCGRVNDVWPANINGPLQTVVSGTRDGVDGLAEIARTSRGRVIELPITIACHTPLMRSAADEVAAALERVRLRRPVRRFYSTVDAGQKSRPADIARALIDGITRPVLFSATAQRMRSDGVEVFLEVGPGGVLRGLLRRCVGELRTDAITSEADIAALASAWREPV